MPHEAVAPAIEAIQLAAVGGLGHEFLEELAGRLSRRVPVPCRIAPAGHGLADGGRERLPGRDQTDADRLLASLEARAAGSEAALVGVTDLDLGIPVFTFVFGRARESGRAAVVSVARLDPAFYGLPPDGDLRAQRTVLEILHELGHVAGLRHCRHHACLMRFAGSVAAVDVRGSAFCSGCSERLPRWLRETGPLSP
jgi:archaemetzincin